jgi:hypothetical protein
MSFYGNGHQCSGVLPAKAPITLSDSGVVTTSTLATPLSVYADGIPLIWDESDLPKITSPKITNVSSTGQSTSATSSSTPGPQTSATHSSRKSGLSQGAQIGIGIGVPLAAILIGVGIFFYFLGRRRRGKHEPLPQADVSQHKGLSELPTTTATALHELS